MCREHLLPVTESRMNWVERWASKSFTQSRFTLQVASMSAIIKSVRQSVCSNCSDNRIASLSGSIKMSP